MQHRMDEQALEERLARFTRAQAFHGQARVKQRLLEKARAMEHGRPRRTGRAVLPAACLLLASTSALALTTALLRADRTTVYGLAPSATHTCAQYSLGSGEAAQAVFGDTAPALVVHTQAEAQALLAFPLQLPAWIPARCGIVEIALGSPDADGLYTSATLAYASQDTGEPLFYLTQSPAPEGEALTLHTQRDPEPVAVGPWTGVLMSSTDTATPIHTLFWTTDAYALRLVHRDAPQALRIAASVGMEDAR